MARLFALAALALGSVAVAQSSDESSTPLGDVDISDIASLPEPTVLGPPMGYVQDATISYDAATATAAVIAMVTQSTAVPAPMPTAAAEHRHNGAVNKHARTWIGRRDLTYPINTTSFPVPAGYTPAFTSLQASTQGCGYLTYMTLKTYDPSSCATFCDQISSCQFFNVYYEKDPDSTGKPVDVIKCSFYSMQQTNATATNIGGYYGTFHITITGSNGYNKATGPVTPAGYTLETLSAAVAAPSGDAYGQPVFIQPVYLPQYDPALCAAACDAQTVYDKSTSTDGCHYQACVYANLYTVSEDGAPKTAVCALYTIHVDGSSVGSPSYTTDGHVYEVSNSIGLTNTTAAAMYPVDPSAPCPSAT